jgi:hypothetical protein
MIPTQMVLTIYFTFAFLCAMPWMLDWAMHGTMPVTSRLLSLIVFSMTLANGGWLLWTVYDERPERLMDALTLLFPMLLFCVFGIVVVMRSLVKIVKQNKSEEDSE